MKKSVWIIPLLLLGLTACGQQADAKTSPKQVFNTTVNANPDTLDPAQVTLSVSGEVINAEQVGLYTYNKYNKVTPGVVKSYTTNADQSVYTFTLKHTKWANGEPVTAADFAYAFKRIADPKTKANQAAKIDFLKNGAAVRTGKQPLNTLGVKALGKYQLQLTLAAPISYLKTLLTDGAYMPVNQKFAEKTGTKFGTSAATILANGPFKLTHFNLKDDSWTFVKNPEYYDKAAVHLTKVKVRVIKDATTGASLFDTGKVDYTTVATTNIARYQGKPTLHQTLTPEVGFTAINTTHKPTSNVHLRRALSLAYNKNAYVKDVLKDGSKALNGRIPSTISTGTDSTKDYRQTTGALMTYNVKQAQAEWAKAKAELGVSSVNLTLLLSDTTDYKNAGEFLQGQIESHLPGVHITLKAVPLAQRIAFERAGDYDLCFSIWTPDYNDPGIFLDPFESTNGLNFPKYHNAEYDQLLKQIHGPLATKPAARLAAIQKAEKLLIKDDAAISAVYQPGLSYLQSTKVSGLLINEFGSSVNYKYIQIK